MKPLTDDQIREVQAFQLSLSYEDKWLFFHRAWAYGLDKSSITFEGKYEVMKKWDSYE